MLLSEDHGDYFFVLYMVYFAAEGWLALLALAHYPSRDHMEQLPDDPFHPVDYEVAPTHRCCLLRVLAVLL